MRKQKAIKTIKPIADQCGITQDELSACVNALAKMGEAGVNASEAGHRVRLAITDQTLRIFDIK